LDKKEVIERIKIFTELVKQNYPVRKVILFGSYSQGTQRIDSDIDVAVVLKKMDGDLLLSKAKLFQLRRDCDIRIEPVLLEEENDPGGFLDEILTNGEIIYSAD